MEVRLTLAAALALALAFPGASASGATALVQAPTARARTLSEGWRFQPDPNGIGDGQHWERADFDRSAWRSVTVPMAWDHFDPVMDGYEGVGWYALALPAELVTAGAWQRLHFGRANHRASVWIDGHPAGENLTGYLPFEVAVTPWLTPGRSAWVVVRVENGVRCDWLPGATVVEWVQYGGLLEPVELLTTAPSYLAHVALRAAPDGAAPDGVDGRVAAVVEVENASASAFAGRVRVEVDGRSAEGAVEVGAQATASVALELTLPGARPWSPETPALYQANVHLSGPAGELDGLVERFGVRSIEARGRELRLNGRPLRIRGVNRYDEFPGHGPVVDAAAIRADLQAVKASGANLVRTHYPQAPVNLALADELGLLFLEELPLNWWRATFRPPVPPEFENDRIIDLAEQALVQMVRRDGNHPALVLWSMANECQTADELGIRAMERLLRRAKALDPTRPVTYVANSRLPENRALALADLVAVNLYYGMWDGPVADDLAALEERVYEPTRKALAEIAALFPEKPILLTEFGTIGIPGSLGDVRFSEDYQAAYVAAVWQAVEAVPEVSGGIVWSWADYRHRQGFTNDFPTCFGPFGLVTLDRRPKKALAELRALWSPSGSGR